MNVNKKNMTTYAFFDVDGTVTRENRMLPFLQYCRLHYSNYHLPRNLFRHWYYQFKLKYGYHDHSRECLNRFYYQQYKGMSVQRVAELGKQWFCKQLAEDQHFFNQSISSRIEAHKKMKHQIVFVTGSFEACIRPVADYFGVNDILCVQPDIQNGIYTGNISGIQTIGEGKVKAIKSRYGDVLNKVNTYAYGDHSSDIPMLKFADFATVITNNKKLSLYAEQAGWTLLH